MSAFKRAFGAIAVLLSASLLAACGDTMVKTSNEDLANGAPFVRIAREALTADGGGLPEGIVGNESFYLAINKQELASRWFLSAYLTQWHPSENTPMRSLGTRVVSFKVQNGKLFVFDATDGKAWSDALDPSVIIEAYPIVTNYAPFNALTGSSNYVLVDPSAGLNRFSFVGDDFAASYQARFQVDLSYLQKYRALADGVSFEQVFTGYTEIPGPGILGYDQPFRGSGTLSVSLRRYTESSGFQPVELPSVTGSGTHFFGSSNVQYVKNEPRLKQYAVKWNIKQGMQPIPWRISAEVARLQNDPRFAGIDVYGAIERGIEGWNGAFGFEVFRVVPTAAGEGPGDDDKNFVVVDTNPGAGLAFANWRENPNTGEIRGASVYFSSVFVEGALAGAPDADVIVTDAGVATDAGSAADAGPVADGGIATDAGASIVPCSPNVVISQIFGGNGATSAFNQDFVELHNRTSDPVSLAGMSLQYASATGTSWQVVPLSGSIAPGGFFLVGLAATADAGVALPAVDAVGTINISSVAGKLALVSNTTALSGCPAIGAPVVDLVGYGATASCSESAPAPAPSSSTAIFRKDAAQACTETNNNGADFVASTPAPRNAASLAAMCTCTSSSGLSPVIPAPVDGGVQLVPPPAAKPGFMLSWDALQANATCSFKSDLKAAAIPAGMTRREYVEAVITHTILHEVGHTLGLRHNFRGSLQASSVMDYVRDDDSVTQVTPGAYDVAAVRYLYGLSITAPSQPFCTDEQVSQFADCDRWDSTSNPLTQDHAPRFQSAVRGLMAGSADLTYGQIWTMTRYVRSPATEAQRLEAFNLFMGDVAPPVRPEITALGANANFWADQLAAMFLANLFLDPAGYRDEIAVNPALNDATFRARVIAVAKGILVNSDKIRGFDTRRVAIDVLKALQTYDAYQALLEARPVLVAEKAGYNALGQALVDDLVKRLDLACTPYFR